MNAGQSTTPRTTEEVYAYLVAELKACREAMGGCAPLPGEVWVRESAIDRLQAAAAKVVEGFDKGIFVRNTLTDTDPNWVMRLVPYMQALALLSGGRIDSCGTDPEPNEANDHYSRGIEEPNV